MKLFAQHAMLPEGWGSNVLIDIGDDGLIAEVHTDIAPGDAEMVAGALLPGMSNVHSHAFQRAMAGLTEKCGPGGDDFWAWRNLMYRFLARITPEDNEAIATQVYIEMLKSGYTSVAEFHYLHHDEAGHAYANRDEMAQRILAAASTAGMGLTLLPVLYRHGGCGGAPPTAHQKRFVLGVDDFNALTQALHQRREGVLRRVGIAPHSLRAVTPDELHAVIGAFDDLDATAPVHIHAAEQQREVDDCLTWSGRRPVAWLLDNCPVNPHWCLVHATHMTDDETLRLAQSGAVAGLCPSTEANLGDGIFKLPAYLMQRGSFGIGGDSHVGVNPFQELAFIEYAQRLKSARRNVLHFSDGASTGGGLWRRALLGGAQALGQRTGAIARGCHADLLVLNADDAALVERSGDDLLDAVIFGPCKSAVRDVMVNGKWVVRAGHHAEEGRALANYRNTLRRLLCN